MGFRATDVSESLGDIEACLRSIGTKLTTWVFAACRTQQLGECEQVRDWRIYADFAHALIAIAAGALHRRQFPASICGPPYMHWTPRWWICACFCFLGPVRQNGLERSKSIRWLDLRGNIPSVVLVTHGKVHDLYLSPSTRLRAGSFLTSWIAVI